MRRTHVISARRTVAPRAGPDPRQQRPVLNGAAICLRAGWTGALGPAGLGAPSLRPWGLLAWAPCPCVLTGSEPWCPCQCLWLPPSGSSQSRWPWVEGQPASRSAAWAPLRLPGPRLAVGGGVASTGGSAGGPAHRGASPEQRGRVLGPWGASASSSGSVVPSRDSPGRTRGCPHGSPLSRGCPQPAALRSPGPGWAGHPSFTAQGARILQGDFYTEMPLEPVWGQNSDMSSI